MGTDKTVTAMQEVIHPVVLCGGSGTRLWPLSRKSFPKQFVPLIDHKSLLQLTLERLAHLNREVCVVTADAHRFMVAQDMQLAQVSGDMILEPVARNTAPAMALAALHAADSQALLLFCPADHHIPDAVAFAATVRRGVAAARAGAIVTFGISPTFPSTAYGYIAQGALRGDGSHQVQQFIEKPDAQRAQRLILGGNVSWNAGIFLCTAQTLANALQQRAPAIWAACEHAMAEASAEIGPSQHRFVRPAADAFAASPSDSIDYAVMEQHTDVAVVRFDGAWSDVGSWNAVAELTPTDPNGNRLHGQALALQSHDNYVHAPHRPVALLGVDNLLVVDTPDAVLVLHRDHAEKVRDVVAALDASKAPQTDTHRKVARPWGWYDAIDASDRFKVKRIQVKPGASLSLQKHHHRAEHWIVVKGTAEVTCGDTVTVLHENQSTYIPLGEVHRLANPGDVPLEIIEVQSGDYLGEDDIVRFEDRYGRHQ
jgi:mannose-1-phosphate guanylyltransferase/mannose-6-phosphate isomerase